MGASVEGAIFGCTPTTYNECLKLQLFGLPNAYRALAERVPLGTDLFLFNFETRQLSCGFQADSDGGWDLQPSAFGGRFKAQVRISRCAPLVALDESEYGHVVEYLEDGRRIKFELDLPQVQQLLELARKKKARNPKAKQEDFNGKLKVNKARQFKGSNQKFRARKHAPSRNLQASLMDSESSGMKMRSKFDWGGFVASDEFSIDGKDKALQRLVEDARAEAQTQLKKKSLELIDEISFKYNPERCRGHKDFSFYNQLYNQVMEAVREEISLSGDTPMALD